MFLSVLFLLTPAAQSVEDVYFGIHVRDPYRWLENKKDPKVQAWIRKQNEAARGYLDGLPQRAALMAQYEGLFRADRVSVPIPAGGRLFYEKHRKDQDKPMVEWRETPGSSEHPIIDVNAMAGGHNVSLEAWAPSWDGKKLLYTSADNNADEAVLHVIDVDTRQEDPHDVIPGANFADPSWGANSFGFYYNRLPVTQGLGGAERVAQSEVHFHVLGQDPAQDLLVYPHTGNPQLFLTPTASEDGRWLFITVQRGWSSSDIYARPAARSQGTFKPVFISTCATAVVSEWKDRFYLFTNLNAPHYRVAVTTGTALKDIIPERADCVIRSVAIVNQRLVLSVLKNASVGVEIYSLEGRLEREFQMPELGEVSDPRGKEAEGSLYFEYESFFIAPRVYESAVPEGDPKIWAEEKIPLNPAPYEVKQVSYPSKDGTLVSMFLIRRRDSPRDGHQAFLMQGYGGFNQAVLPHFNAGVIPWLEAGGGLAVPNLRGGGEYGEAWHRAGMLIHKQNTFDDFIAAAEFLIREGYTQPDRLVMDGTSNGGLLVAAALTQRPDLFRAAVCKVPLADMIRYSLFGEGHSWIPEYGDPKIEAEFRALYAYSPYHHVKPARYPATLLIAADSDDRVDSLHARKMAAALQAAQQGPEPILLLTQSNAGHGGADRTRNRIEESADRLSFLMQQAGMTAGKK